MKKTEIYYRLQFTDNYMQKFANSIDEFTQKNTSMALLVDVKKIVQDLINTYYARSINIPSQKEFNLKAIKELSKTQFIKETIIIEYIDDLELIGLNIPEIKESSLEGK
jgi:hypothetical protein